MREVAASGSRLEARGWRLVVRDCRLEAGDLGWRLENEFEA